MWHTEGWDRPVCGSFFPPSSSRTLPEPAVSTGGCSPVVGSAAHPAQGSCLGEERPGPRQPVSQMQHSQSCPLRAAPGSDEAQVRVSASPLVLAASLEKGTSGCCRPQWPHSPAGCGGRWAVAVRGWVAGAVIRGPLGASCPVQLPSSWHSAGLCSLPCPPSAHRQADETKTAASLFSIISVTACNGAEKL